ncbi:uncharacterized protein [Aristolochia californica]|uniref:uncharacterized protein n=1 Tax=Aristolochia californica TaxID=171875 RepID=UPI0035DF20E4
MGCAIPVFETPDGKTGALIYWENRMPLLITALYAQGVEIYCAPTADAREEEVFLSLLPDPFWQDVIMKEKPSSLLILRSCQGNLILMWLDIMRSPRCCTLL